MERIELECDIPNLDPLSLQGIGRRNGKRVIPVESHFHIVVDGLALLQYIIVLLRVHRGDGELREVANRL